MIHGERHGADETETMALLQSRKSSMFAQMRLNEMHQPEISHAVRPVEESCSQLAVPAVQGATSHWAARYATSTM